MKCTYKGAHSNHNRQKKLKETQTNWHENYQISGILQISRQISRTKIFKSIYSMHNRCGNLLGSAWQRQPANENYFKKHQHHYNDMKTQTIGRLIAATRKSDKMAIGSKRKSKKRYFAYHQKIYIIKIM